MEIIPTSIAGLLLLKPKVFYDTRGYFLETYNALSMPQGVATSFLQDNLSFSSKNILRGLHFQNPPFAQAKLVRVLQGAVLDVAVDLRKGSTTYGKHVAVELNADNKYAFYIPEGFAHGFLTLEDNTLFQYKCSTVYHPSADSGLLWNDPALGIDWGIDTPILSDKDILHTTFDCFESPFYLPSSIT